MEGRIAGREILNSRQFQVAIKRLADDLSYGTDHSPFLGSGVEYVQSRLYQFGDPVKSIDWKITARTGKPYVKEFEAPKRMPVYLLVDTSASMTLRSQHRSKYEIGVFLAGGLALACLDRISPVGVLGVGERDIHIRPSLSRSTVFQWLHLLRTYRYDEPTTLADRLARLGPSLAQRVMLIVMSDLHDDDALPILKRMGQEHDCVVLQLRDPAEIGLRGVGFIRGREAETGRAFVSRGIRGGLDHDGTARELKRAGIDHLVIDTDKPFETHLRHFFKNRGLLGRGAR